MEGRDTLMIELREGLKYRLIDIEYLEKLIPVLVKCPSMMGLDLETTGLNSRVHKVVTIQFGTVNNAFILDCRPFYSATPEVQAKWKKILSSLVQACPRFAGHNLKFDWLFLAYHFDVRLPCVIDTMIQELVIHGVGLGKAEANGIVVKMEETAARYNLSVSKELQKWSVGLDEKSAWYDPYPEEFLQYCAQDVYIPLLIHDQQKRLLEQLELSQIADLENACLPAVARMEYDGCYIDREKWQSIIDKKKSRMELLQGELEEGLSPYIQEIRQLQYEDGKLAFESWQLAYEYTLEELKKKHTEGNTSLKWGDFKQKGLQAFREEYPRPKTPKFIDGPINLASPSQLLQALQSIGIETDSTDEGHLLPFRHSYPLIEKLLTWKELHTFVKMFGEKILEKIGPDNRIHPTYNQIGAATGRFSCSSPNWQQIPSHEPEETSVRRCVIGENGNAMLTADFSNIEARILADISGDNALLNFFVEGGDLHSTTARLMFGLSPEVDPKHAEIKPGLSYRSVAKSINFGLVYGGGPGMLSSATGVSLEEAKELIKKYFEAYPGVARHLEESAKQALQNGYSCTLAGRKRFYDVLPDPEFDRETMTWEDFRLLRSHARKINGSYERQAKNAPIQGSNADITKYALILLNKHLPLYVKIVACVHDEIVLECSEEKAEAVAKLLAQVMYTACKKYLKKVHIPPVDVEICGYWKKG